MNATVKVTASEFQKNLGRYQDAAQRGPVAITENGRVRSVLMSADMFEIFLKGRISRSIEHLDEETIRSIAESRVPEGYEHLDELIDDWKP